MPLIDDDGRRIKSTPKAKKSTSGKKSSSGGGKKRSGGGSGSSRGTKGGDWAKVLFGGRGISRTSDFWAKSSIRGGPHTGVDIGAPMGTKIYTPLGGTVVKSTKDGAFGNVVMIRLQDGKYMMFSHLSTRSVGVGDKIDAGTNIGRVGMTGRTTGPHLHLELRTKASGGSFGNRESWRFADPIKYLNGQGINVDKLHGGTGGGGGGGGGGGSSVSVSRGGGGGGGGGGGAYGYSKKEMYEYLESMFGDLKILQQLDAKLVGAGGGKSIKWLINTLVKKRITDANIAATYMAQTGFFKKYSVEVANRLVQEKSRPGVVKSEVGAKQASIAAAMNAEGVHLAAADLRKLARDAWIYGWNDEQISAKIAGFKSTTLSGGRYDDALTEIAQYADDYGVSFSNALHKQFNVDYLNGRGAGGIQSKLRDMAAAKYRVFADDINAGQSLRSLTDGYFQTAAQLLELDPDTIDWDDPLFRNGKAFTTTDANGKLAIRQLDDFERMVKQDNRWMNTSNAKDTISSGVYTLMQKMGLAG